VAGAEAVLRRQFEDAAVEHHVGQDCARDATDDLNNAVPQEICAADARACAATQPPVGERDHGVEVCAGHGSEQQDEHCEPEGGRGRVFEQLQPNVVGRQPCRSDPGSDHDRDEQGRAGEFG